MTTFEKVRKIVADKLSVPEAKVTEESKFVNDLGADSLDVVEFVMEVEKEFDITIPDEEAANLEKGHDWWTIGGRFKLTSSGESDGYGLDGEQGYLWLAAGTENNAWRVEDYTGKQIEEATSATDRAFNVRCVEGE